MYTDCQFDLFKTKKRPDGNHPAVLFFYVLVLSTADSEREPYYGKLTPQAWSA